MWFTSRSHNRQSSISGERRRTHGSRRQRLACRPAVAALEERRLLSTLTVTSNYDGGGIGDGTLRGEILAAAPSGDTIVFAPSLNGQTITLTNGQLEIDKSLTIQGPGASLLAVSGNNVSRVFQVGQTATISGLTVEGGNATYDPNYPAIGGGILNRDTTLTLSGCVVTGNYATTTRTPSEGGGIANLRGATMTLSGCTVTGNVSGYDDWGAGEGGGIYNDGTMTLSGCTVTRNTCIGQGGGIFNGGDGHLTILSSVVKNNTHDNIYNIGWISIS
jgi:hypothetical protein